MLYTISFYNFKIFPFNGLASLFREMISVWERGCLWKKHISKAHIVPSSPRLHQKDSLRLNKSLNKPFDRLLEAFADVVHYIKKDL